MEHPFFRLIQALLFVGAILFGLNQLGLIGPSQPEVRVTRIIGEDPITAAATAAREAYGGGVETVIVVGAEALADGVVATGLAGALNAPILLNEVERISPQTRDVIRELDATRAIMIGGSGAMQPAVETGLAEELELDTLRIAGASRFDTARLVADEFARATEVGEANGLRTALIVPSEDVAAGLAAGGLAAARGGSFPVLYSQDGFLPEPTVDALTRLDIQQLVAVGTVAGFSGPVVTVTNPSDTADQSSDLRGFRPSRVVVVPDGDDARALIGAPVAGREAGVILPVSAAEPWLAANCGTMNELFVIAGVDVIDEAVVGRLTLAATTCGES